ncbi:MAG TPA: CATRA conflict system CASPASE/TPR repeat-associated protein [Streptosporangiaceae bacterium]|nr:CATRA conflict system CASPASE/TPR repeat-associated protein [Streptosporangiaceae bacterium]
MTAPPVVDQEFVAHFYAPLDGPQADEAYRQVQRMWEGCRRQLGMTEPIAGLQVPLLAPETRKALPADGVAAAQESPTTDRQSVLRRMHDVLNLSVALAQPMPEGLHPRPGGRLTPVQAARLPTQRRMGWADFAQIWAQASMPGAEAMLGEIRLFLARTPPGDTGVVAATAELGQSLDPLLPYQEDRPQDWWRWGTTTAAGYAVWDTRLAADTSSVREIVLIAAADCDEELSAWAWSDGTPGIPPFARYLMYAAKLRYEARLLDAWHRRPPANDVDEVVAELNVALTRDAPDADDAALLRSRLSRLLREETRLTNLEADLARLRQTVSSALGNLSAAAGPDAGNNATGMFAADQALARWLTEQVEDDLNYVRIDLGRASRVRPLVAEELDQAERADQGPSARTAGSTAGEPGEVTSSRKSAEAAAQTDRSDVIRRVFVVHGRDGALTASFRDLLRAVHLEPLEWEKLVEATGSTAPYLGQVVAQAPHLAQATLVLLSPDDIVELHPDLFQENDHPQERARSGQARPNVLFELGLALMAYPERTIVVEVGQMRPVGDLAGLNVIRFDGSAVAIKKVLDRLRQAECPVDISGTDWLDTGRFAVSLRNSCDGGCGVLRGRRLRHARRGA